MKGNKCSVFTNDKIQKFNHFSMAVSDDRKKPHRKHLKAYIMKKLGISVIDKKGKILVLVKLQSLMTLVLKLWWVILCCKVILWGVLEGLRTHRWLLDMCLFFFVFSYYHWDPMKWSKLNLSQINLIACRKYFSLKIIEIRNWMWTFMWDSCRQVPDPRPINLIQSPYDRTNDWIRTFMLDSSW